MNAEPSAVAVGSTTPRRGQRIAKELASRSAALRSRTVVDADALDEDAPALEPAGQEDALADQLLGVRLNRDVGEVQGEGALAGAAG